MGQLSCVYDCSNVVQAHLLKSLLEDYGIKAAVHVPIEAGQIEVGRAQVAVDGADQEIASGIVAAFHRHVVQPRRDELVLQRCAVVLGGPASDEWWTCDVCGTSLVTCCPECDSEGSHFDVAYRLPADDEANPPPGAVCLTCDALFDVVSFEPCAECTRASLSQQETPRPVVTAWRLLLVVFFYLVVVAIVVWRLSGRD